MNVLNFQGTVDFSPRLLLEELFHKVDNLPKWNPTVLETRTVQVCKVYFHYVN